MQAIERKTAHRNRYSQDASKHRKASLTVAGLLRGVIHVGEVPKR